jgi:hypothetical protein
MATRNASVTALVGNADAERQLADAVAVGARGQLGQVGLDVVSIDSLAITLSEEDLARLGEAAAGAHAERGTT